MNFSAKRFNKNPNLVTRSIAGETLIVPVSGRVGDLNSIFTLNDMGSAIWELVDGQKDVRQIVDAVYTGFDAPREEITGDVEEFLSSLSGEGLIQPVEQSSA